MNFQHRNGHSWHQAGLSLLLALELRSSRTRAAVGQPRAETQRLAHGSPAKASADRGGACQCPPSSSVAEFD